MDAPITNAVDHRGSSRSAGNLTPHYLLGGRRCDDIRAINTASGAGMLENLYVLSLFAGDFSYPRHCRKPVFSAAPKLLIPFVLSDKLG
jgi:hypothetical protein